MHKLIFKKKLLSLNDDISLSFVLSLSLFYVFCVHYKK
jgi:hypothetical protein